MDFVISLLISFAVGAMLGDVVIHITPDLFEEKGGQKHENEEHNQVGLYIILGILIFFVIEKLLNYFGVTHTHGEIHVHTDIHIQ